MKELALLFVKLGTIGFGGPAAHIAMMEDEVVRRRAWLTPERFLDLVGATNIIPGPNSTEMAIHIGYVRAGWRGSIVAGACFILPAILISLLLAFVYVTYGSTPDVGAFMAGIRSAIIAIIAAAVLRLGRPILKKKVAVVLGISVVVLNLAGLNEILLLGAAGVIGLLVRLRGRIGAMGASFMSLVPAAGLMLTAGSSTGGPTLVALGLFFLKIGSVLYGSGYVLVAFLQSGLVESHHWLSQTQLLDAIAVGQFTPGPVLSAATFIGFLILGVPGAAVATTGIFLPSFVFVLISGPFIPRLRRSPLAGGFLDGVNAASLGLMLAVTILLAEATLRTVPAWAIFLASAAAIVRWNVHPAWVVLGSAALGWLLSLPSP